MESKKTTCLHKKYRQNEIFREQNCEGISNWKFGIVVEFC